MSERTNTPHALRPEGAVAGTPSARLGVDDECADGAVTQDELRLAAALAAALEFDAAEAQVADAADAGGGRLARAGDGAAAVRAPSNAAVGTTSDSAGSRQGAGAGVLPEGAALAVDGTRGEEAEHRALLDMSSPFAASSWPRRGEEAELRALLDAAALVRVSPNLELAPARREALGAELDAFFARRAAGSVAGDASATVAERTGSASGRADSPRLRLLVGGAARSGGEAVPSPDEAPELAGTRAPAPSKRRLGLRAVAWIAGPLAAAAAVLLTLRAVDLAPPRGEHAQAPSAEALPVAAAPNGVSGAVGEALAPAPSVRARALADAERPERRDLDEGSLHAERDAAGLLQPPASLLRAQGLALASALGVAVEAGASSAGASSQGDARAARRELDRELSRYRRQMLAALDEELR